MNNSSYEGLEPIGKERIGQAAVLLAEAFDDNPLFTYLLPDAAQRSRILPLIFRNVVETGIYSGGVYTTSDAMEGIFCPHMSKGKVAPGYVLAVLKWNLLFFQIIGKTPLIALFKRFIVVSAATSGFQRALSALKPCLSIDMVAVDKRFRGQKFMSKMMRSAINKAQREGIRCVLETETEDNAQIYKHFGFALHSKIEAIPGKLYYYIMVLEPGREDGLG